MNKSMILKNHLEFKKTSVTSKEKLADIKRYLGRFIESSKKPLKNFIEEDIVRFINSLDYKTRTINDIKTYIKVFIKWYYPDWSSKFRNLERICKMQQPSKAYQPEQMISLEEIKKIIEGEKDLMYQAFWGVFFYGGFRPSECCNLKKSQVTFENEGAIIKVHSTKTNRDFYKSIPKDIAHILKEWFKCEECDDLEYIFPSPINKGEPIKSRGVCGRLKKLSNKTIGKDVVPYILRHSIATILYSDDSRKDDDTANQLGHNKSMKSVYLNLDEEKLRSRARRLWIKTKQLPPEEREKLEQEIKELREKVKQIYEMKQKQLKVFQNFQTFKEEYEKRLNKLEKQNISKK